jgi:DNA-binding NarL/FixJ family response regulator
MARNEMRRIRILVQHAEPLVTLGLVTALRQHPDFDVLEQGVGFHADRSAGLEVVITDYVQALSMAAGSRRSAGAGPKVLVLTAQDREHEIRLALESGVHGYLLLGCGLEELVSGVRMLARGSRYLCMEVAQRIADSLTRHALTTRESDVLRLLARGECNKAIARELDIAVGTVKTHVRAIMDKLNATSRTQAASVANERGLLDGRATLRPEPSLRFQARLPVRSAEPAVYA